MAKIVEQLYGTGNKLQSINPTIGVYQHLRSLSRRNAVIIHRLRIGYSC